MQDRRYPIGRCPSKSPLAPEERAAAIDAIEQTPQHLKAAIAGLVPEQLDTPYRPGGWTVRQVIHHLPDSHMNSYVRCKLALTEDEPTIKPYDEARWAALKDSQEMPIEVSIAMLDALHRRWVTLLRGLGPEDFARRLLHPERGAMTMDDVLTTYSWYGQHHVAHITALRDHMGWG